MANKKSNVETFTLPSTQLATKLAQSKTGKAQKRLAYANALVKDSRDLAARRIAELKNQ